jgi:hypothetical protein
LAIYGKYGGGYDGAYRGLWVPGDSHLTT